MAISQRIGAGGAIGLLLVVGTQLSGAIPARGESSLVFGGRLDEEAVHRAFSLAEAGSSAVPTHLEAGQIPPARSGANVGLRGGDRPGLAPDRMALPFTRAALGLSFDPLQQFGGSTAGEPADSLLGSLVAAVSQGFQPRAPLSGGVGLVLNLNALSPIQLQPSTAGQSVDLFLRNDGASVDVGGLDLKIAILGSGIPAPAIQGVDLRAGAVFTTGNSAQSADPLNNGQLQYWSVSINDPSSPPTIAGGGAPTKVGTLTISTVGVTSGQWTLSALLPQTGMLDPAGGSLTLSLVDGTLQVGAVVPEPATTVSLAGAALLGWALVRRRRS